MTIPDRYLDLLPWAIATVLVAGIVHIVSVLLMPDRRAARRAGASRRIRENRQIPPRG